MLIKPIFVEVLDGEFVSANSIQSITFREDANGKTEVILSVFGCGRKRYAVRDDAGAAMDAAFRLMRIIGARVVQDEE